MLKLILGIFKGDVALFGITFCGYGLISFLVTNAESSQIFTVPYRAIALFLNLIFLLKHLKIIRLGKFPKTKNTLRSLSKKIIFWPLLLLIIAYSFRVLYTIFTYASTSALIQTPENYAQFWFLISLLPALNFLFLDRTKSERYLFIAWLMHAFMGVAILLLQPSSSSFFVTTGRLSGEALNPISLGHYAASLAIMSVFIWLRTKKSSLLLFGQPRFRYVYLLTAGIGTVGMLLSASRGPIIAEVLCLTLILLSTKKLNFGFLVTVVVLLGGMLISLSFVSDSLTTVSERLFLVSDEIGVGDGAKSEYGRGNLGALALNAIQKYPLIGAGIELPNGYGYPHNLYLESFLAMGIVGGLVFCGLVFYVALKSVQILSYRHPKAEWGWLGALFIQYLVNGAFSGSLYASSLFW
jgi:hypothetical protein